MECITVWHGREEGPAEGGESCTKNCGTTTDIYTSRCRKRVSCIMKDPTRPAHTLFVPLPSGGRLRSIRSRNTRLGNSFYLEAVRLLNSGGPLLSTEHNSEDCNVTLNCHFNSTAHYLNGTGLLNTAVSLHCSSFPCLLYVCLVSYFFLILFIIGMAARGRQGCEELSSRSESKEKITEIPQRT